MDGNKKPFCMAVIGTIFFGLETDPKLCSLQTYCMKSNQEQQSMHYYVQKR